MKQQTKQKLLGLSMLAFALSGCESIPFLDNSSDYKSAGRAKPLEVPPDLTAARTSDAYNVPGSATYSTYSENQATNEPGVEQVLPKVENVRMVKAGAQRWLVVDAPAEKVWPVVREFWLEQGFAVRVENADIGIMETDWISAEKVKMDKEKNGGYLSRFDQWMDELSGMADRRKFRTRLERGEKEGTTEIFMTHRTVAGTPDNGLETVEKAGFGKFSTGYRSDAGKQDEKFADIDSDLNAELLRRLMLKLGVAEKQAEQLVNNPIPAKRAEVVKEADSSVTLRVDDEFDRAWRRVGLALDRVGFVMEDKDRSNGLFYVRYSDVDIDSAPAKKKGLLEALKFWGDDKEEAANAPQDEKSTADKLKFWKGKDDKTDTAKQYRIRVSENENGTSDVNVVDKDGKRNPSNVANRIIALLYEQLK
jgi:outer membrane protein assembly factor BamC